MRLTFGFPCFSGRMSFLRVRVFGGLSVESQGPALGRAAQQPKRLALLAMIARSGAQGVTRDHLIACLWPESDTTKARNALNQALHGLRRDLLRGAVFEGREILRLNPRIATSDVAEFEAALADARLEQAVALYQGPLLLGVHLREGREFDEWVESERAALSRRFLGALQELIAQSRARGDRASELRFGRQLVDADPYDAALLLQLVEILVASGDRPGAVVAAESYCRRITRDLEIDPDPSVGRRLDLLRAPMPAILQEVNAGEAPIYGGTPSEHAEPATRLTDPSPGATDTPMLSRTRLTSAIRVLIASGTIAFAAFAATAALRARGAREGSLTTAIAVLPFSARGDSVDTYVAEGLARLVARGLDGAGLVRAEAYPGSGGFMRNGHTTADSSAALTRHFQLQRYVTGDVFVSRGQIEIRAALHDATRHGRVLGIAVARGSADSLFAMAESISRRLLEWEPSIGSGLVRGGLEATSSLAAFRSFIEGESFFRASRFAEAVASFQQAVHADTAFALAYYRLAVAADWNAQGELIAPASAIAMRLAHRLPWRERLLLEGATAWRNGRNNEAESAFLEITSRDPNDAEAWFQLAEVLFHSNSIRGRSFLQSREPFHRVTELDPANRGAFSHLARISAYEGDSRGADSLLRIATRLMPTAVDPELSVFHAMVAGDSAARESEFQKLALEPQRVAHTAALRFASYARDVQLAELILRRGLRDGSNLDGDANGIQLATMLSVAQGQFRRALRQSDMLGEVLPFSGLEMRALLLSLPVTAYTVEERAAVVRELESATRLLEGVPRDRSWALQNGLAGPVRWYLLGLLSARAGDTVRLRVLADSIAVTQLAGPSRSVANALAAGLRAHRLAQMGDLTGALRELKRAPQPGDQILQGHTVVSQLSERFLRATMLEQTHRFDEAVEVYGSLIYGNANDLLLAAPALLRRARLLASLGRAREAIADYESFLRAWKRPDAPLLALVDSARSELATLSAVQDRRTPSP